MNELIKQLDNIQLDSLISWDNLSSKLGAQLIMKRVLLAAGSGEPLNVDDFVFASRFIADISPIQYLGKLTDRDVPWDDRLTSMENIGGGNLGNNPLCNNLLAPVNIPDLLWGWATQLLDNKPEVQKTAINYLPNIFNKCLENGPEITIGHLEEILDNLFKILDDPKCFKNHPAAKDAIAKVVDDIINMEDPGMIIIYIVYIFLFFI